MPRSGDQKANLLKTWKVLLKSRAIATTSASGSGRPHSGARIMVVLDTDSILSAVSLRWKLIWHRQSPMEGLSIILVTENNRESGAIFCSLLRKAFPD